MNDRRLPLSIYALPLVAAFMLPNLATPLMELWRQDIGFSSGMLTLIFVMYLGGLAPAFLLAPSLGRLWGRRTTQILACVLGILSCAFYVFGVNIALLLVARVLTGLCSGLILVHGPSAVQAMADSAEKAKATFIATMGIAIGLAGGPLFAGFIAQWLPWPTKTVFVLMAALLALSLLLITTEPETTREKVTSWLPFSGLGSKSVRTIAAGLGAFSPGMTAAAIVLALSPTLLMGLGGPTGPLGAGLMAGGMYAMSPIAQSMVRKLRSMAHIRLSLGLIVLAMISFAFAVTSHNLPILILSAILMGAGQGISNLGSFGLIHQEVTPDNVPGATAVLSLGTYASASIVPLAGGFLIDAQGLESAGVYMALGVVVMVLIGAFFARDSYVAAHGES
ncbi:MFS transporter [Corynebacterium sp. 320]|uniref:MFS transporter n=1 Tax=Corynebacterium TaxID=1716 RepID=UPI00125CC8B1|nr:MULTISPECIES: MFS transporter [Corynebacterium]KAB1504466.1 MFS transporter [Corynebacterium sp. 320]KAB1552436.1 MFS transporter [Corynebacterium sp. 321]KAB1554350.1 MFS transporter [Corynebacterium sp. 319]KAB3528602.1 MFS transporter [Corynebacterium sp. 250]KAB3539907.1 MFS transporter [Corynebacterium sp. 366]